MKVMAVARSIGLVSDDRSEVSGTIDEAVVLASISELAAANPGNQDLFADAAMRVQLARSAGAALADPIGALHPSRDGASLQLRYRSEMAEVFIDLAIDVGLRDAESLAEAGA